MHRLVLKTRKAKINKNHHALYTAFSFKVANSSAQNGPNWLT
jgi:hypothetical protein